MQVSLWMSRPAITVPPELPIARAAIVMAQRRVRRLIVAEHGVVPRLSGIVSLHDVVRAFPHDVNPLSASALDLGPIEPVSTIMTRAVRTVAPDAPIEDAASLMARHRIGALPVVHGDEPVGVITESDLFRAMVELLGAHEPGTRVTFAVSPGEDVVAFALAAAGRHRVLVRSVLGLHHGDAWLGLMRLQGDGVDAVVDELWQSRHRVLSVRGTNPVGRP